RVDEVVGELVEVRQAAGGEAAGGGQQPGDVGARPALAGRRGDGPRGVCGDELRGAARHPYLSGLVVLPAVVDRRGAVTGVPVETRRQLAVVVVGAVELLAEAQRPALAGRGRYRRSTRAAATRSAGGAARWAGRGGRRRRGRRGRTTRGGRVGCLGGRVAVGYPGGR